MRSYFKSGLLAAICLSVLALGGFAAHQSIELTQAQAAIEAKDITIKTQSDSLTELAATVDTLSGQVDDLVTQAELVAALNAEHEQNKQVIADTGNDWLNNSNKLQVSEHETTRTWAAMPLPDDARRMLIDASTSGQNSHSKQTSIRPATFKHDGYWLPATAI